MKRKFRLNVISVSAMLAVLLLASCAENSNQQKGVQVVSAMRNVMWSGELEGKVLLDTLNPREGLYGLGPLEYLQGELLIANGQGYVSKVVNDSTMLVDTTTDLRAPFFVFGWQSDWKEHMLPSHIHSIKDMEHWLVEEVNTTENPFILRLKGHVSEATIHIQDLPKGTKVSSPAEAHQGQTNYKLTDEEVEIIGFFSTAHQGVFTHHDSFMHLHLITQDQQKMGHLDAADLSGMTLYLPDYLFLKP